MIGRATSVTAAAPRTASSRRRRRRSGRDGLAGVLFVLPSVGVIGVFFLAPLALTVWMSLNDWPLFGERHYVGVQNYRTLVSDSSFWSALAFTTKYTLLVTVAIFAVASGLAYLVHRDRPGVGVLRTAYFLPVVTGLAAASLLWGWLYNSQVGIFSALLQSAGLTRHPVEWLSGGTSALIAVIVMIVWKTAGLTMVLLLVGFQQIPRELYEAAAVDGAGRWPTLRQITLPLMKRTIALALLLSVTGSYLAFDQFYVMTRGGPDNSTITAVYEIYRSAFISFRLGYAAALAIALLVILIALNAAQLRLLRRRDA